MGKKLVKGGWVYDYDISAEYRRKYDCELTDVRYVLGEQFDTDKRNVLICIGINPSMQCQTSLTRHLGGCRTTQKEAVNMEHGIC